MKYLFLALSVFFFSFNFQTIEASNTNEPIVLTSKVNNYIITTGVSNYIPVMIMTAAEMRKEESKKIGEFEVVIYGAAVKVFADKVEGAKLVAMAKEAGAKIVLCDFALKHFGISQEELPEGITYVHNAFTYTFNKKSSGYIVLSV